MQDTPSDIPLDEPIGLIAGRGDFPLEFCRSARRAGVSYIGVIAIQNDASPELEPLADRVDWTYPGQFGKAIRHLKDQNIRHLFFAGQIKPTRLFTGLRPDWRAVRLLSRLREKNAETLFTAAAEEFEKQGIRVLPATLIMKDALAGEGVLGRVKPGRQQWEDITLGVRIARAVSDLDIGQTVFIKQGTVVAVEAFEGTDKAIRRGGDLSHGGGTAVKVAKPNHDMRFDVPCIGMRTVESLELAKARALAVQADRTLIIDRPAVIEALDRANMAIVGIHIPDPDS